MYILVDSYPKFQAMIDSLKAEEVLIVDVESTGLKPKYDKIVGFVLAGFTDPNVYYTPIRHVPTFAPVNQLPAEFVEEQVARLLDGKQVVGHNIVTFDRLFLAELKNPPNIKVKSDTMVEVYITGFYPKVGLKDSARAMYKVELQDIEDVYPAACEKIKNKVIVHFERVPVEIAYKYACDDGFYCRKIHLDLYSKYKDRFVYQLEMAILYVAEKHHRIGIRVDYARCEAEYNRLIQEAEAIDLSVHRYLKRCYGIEEHFDFGSSPQVAHLLVDKLNIIEEVLTEKGNRSTSKKNFEGLRDSNPIVNAIFTYREIIKAATGFFGIYPDYEEADGRMHPSMLTCHVITGRTAMADPNTQQLSHENKWVVVDFDDLSADNCKICSGGRCIEQVAGKAHCNAVKFKTITTSVRDVFIPRDGYMFVEGDYSQIELMVIAAVACESKMLQAFRDNEDIHAKTATIIYQKTLDKVTPEERQVGKTTNFRFNYGGGPGGLAQQLGISMRQAKSIVEAHKAGYPMLDRFAEKSYLTARQTGYVDTLFGRRRYCPEFVSTDPKIAAKGKRLATNIPVQGGAADIAKIGIVRQDKIIIELEGEGYKYYWVNFVHDSYLWEVPIVSTDAVKQGEFLKMFTERMTRALCFDVMAVAVVRQSGVKEFPKLKADYKFGMTYNRMVKDGKWYEMAQKNEITFELPKVIPVVIALPVDEVKLLEPAIVFNLDIIDSACEANFKALNDLLKANPGNNLFIVRYRGEVSRLDQCRTSLGLNDFSLIKSVIPCQVFVDGQSVNAVIASQLEL